jgi:hypothetical protein
MDPENVFADVPNEGNSLDIDKAFERLEDKDKGGSSSESQPEKKTESPSRKGEEDSTSSEDKTPFHKHPRWIKTQETLNEYKARIEDFEKKFAEVESKNKTVELPQWWKDAYGDTDDAKKRYGEYETATQAERDRLKQEVKDDLKKEVEQETTEGKQGEEYVDEQLAEMSDEGLKFDRNGLLKFMVDFQEEFGAGSLLDKEGNYDFRKALAMKNRMEPNEPDESSETKKRLASQAGRSKVSPGNSSKIPIVSTRVLRKGGWREAGI